MPLTLTTAEFKRQIQKLQWSILIVNIFIIAIGGVIFGLAVASRPILRVTHKDYFIVVESICNVLAATGIVQLVVSGYDIFAGCWRMINPLNIAMVLTGGTVILEMVAISSVFYIKAKVNSIVTEDVIRPWFVWECLERGSCKLGILFYVNDLMIPQACLAILTIALQCTGIMFLYRLARLFRQRQWDHLRARSLFEKKKKRKSEKKFEKLENNNIPMDVFGEEHDDECEEPSTPMSILEEEHGYVSAAGNSFDQDYDDVNVVRHRSPKNKSQPQFNTIV